MATSLFTIRAVYIERLQLVTPFNNTCHTLVIYLLIPATLSRPCVPLVGLEQSGVRYPMVFDTLMRFRDKDIISKGPIRRGRAVVSNDLWVETARGDTLKLYAPPVFVQGSSISHLDEDEFRGRGADALMTPWVQYGEFIAAPAYTTLCILEAMGWYCL